MSQERLWTVVRRWDEIVATSAEQAMDEMNLDALPSKTHAVLITDPERSGPAINEFRIVVDVGPFGPLVPQTVTASNVREALMKAYALPPRKWIPIEDTELPDDDTDE